MDGIAEKIRYTALFVPPTASLNRNTPRCEHWETRTHGFELMADDEMGKRTFSYVCERCIPVKGTTSIFR